MIVWCSQITYWLSDFFGDYCRLALYGRERFLRSGFLCLCKRPMLTPCRRRTEMFCSTRLASMPAEEIWSEEEKVWRREKKEGESVFTKAALELFGIKNPLDKLSAHFLANWGDSSQLSGFGQTTSTQISSSVWRSATIGHLMIYHWNLKKSTLWCRSLGFRSTSTFKWVKFDLLYTVLFGL